MTGSEKQIKWAEDIANRAFEHIDCMVITFKHFIEIGEDPVDWCGYDLEAVEDLRAQVTAAIKKVEKASTIIEKRNRLTQSHLEKIARAITANRKKADVK